MQPYTIEQNIPLTKPSKSGGTIGPSRVAVTLQALKKGESFLISKPLEALRGAKFVRDFNGRERKRERPRVFVTRKDADGGLRVWRTK